MSSADYMIPVCRDEISTPTAGTDFTLQLDVEIKFRPDNAGQYSSWYLFGDRKIAPRMTATQQIPPWKITTQKIAPRNFAPNILPPGWLPPRNFPLEDCPPLDWTPKNSTWKITTWGEEDAPRQINPSNLVLFSTFIQSIISIYRYILYHYDAYIQS